MKTVNGAGREYWRVRLGKRFTGGRVIKRDFDSVGAARDWIFGDAQQEKARPGAIADLRKSHGASAFVLSAAQLAEAANAYRRVQRWGLSLTAALDLAERYRAPEIGTIEIDEAIRRCVAEKEKLNRAVTTLYDLKTRWKRFAAWLPATKRAAFHTIRREDVERFLQSCELSPVAERNMVRALSSLFSWGAKAKLISENPSTGWDFSEAKKSLARDREPRILTISEAEKILRLAMQGSTEPIVIGGQAVTIEPGEMVPYVATGMFGGLRPFEERRIGWEHFWWGKKGEHHEAHIEISPTVAQKTGQTRHVPLEPVLVEWLKPYRREKGKIIPAGFERKFQAFSKLCWGNEGWPEDILRHSYASYLLARDKDAGAVAENLGHRDTTSTLFRHYRAAIKFRRDVLAYWSCTPRLLLGKKNELQNHRPIEKLREHRP